MLRKKFHQGIPQTADGMGKKTHPAISVETVEERQLAKRKLGSSSYWKMAGAMGYLIRNEMIHAGYGLMNVVEYYKSLHGKRLEADRIVLDWRYNSLFG